MSEPSDKKSLSPTASAEHHAEWQRENVHKVFFLGRIYAIARNTLTELVRLKVFYFLLIFGLLIIGNSAFMLQFSFQQEFQVLKDVSLGAMSIFTSLLAIVATAALIPKDIEDRTLYTILAKPVPRLDYLLGKLGGVLLLLAVATVLMSFVFAIVLYVREQWVIQQILIEARSNPELSQEIIQREIAEIKSLTFSTTLFAGVAVIYIKAALLAALTLFVSTFATSSIFTIIIVVAVYFVGHLQATAREYWMAGGDIGWLTKVFLGLVSLIFPDLQAFNLVDDIVAGNMIGLALFLKTMGLGLLYVMIYTLLGYFVFAKKEL